jgi:ATP-dependent RNA helicase SUPV3L1/SUV3
MGVTALLGPTNTGKTHIAMERLLEHRTGMVGFPLRLLARENYDKVVAAKGPQAVALITGEERILPERPSHFICTAEAMPLDRRVDFVAIDEVQLAADRERGHIFTDRLLRARGLEETMLLGSETIRPLVRALVPEAAHVTRARLSTLRYIGPKKLNRLPRRSAVIVFSLVDLYELAERLRHETGGVALVFGALSPRTRNAQVGLYQAGEVDYLVATDAIGMGLNLDIDHVAFTRLAKFDGRGARALKPAEVAQIAGRAGRHVRDGTFGATADLGELDERLVRAIESHRFEPLESVFWRNPDLDFRSLGTLIASLEATPPRAELKRMRHADDHRVLLALRAEAEVLAETRSPERVRLLWEVCQIPDFRNVMSEAHARLLAQIYRHLVSAAQRLPEDWVAAQVGAIDRSEGDVDTLLGRIASIRTWTYVSHRAGWLADPRHWQERTRRIEDRLSDALHERLTEQFVDRRAAVIARAEPDDLLAEITEEGEVRVQGLVAGKLDGFRFAPGAELRERARGLLAAANRVLREGIAERVRLFAAESDEALHLGEEGGLFWRDARVARLAKGDASLEPRVDVLPSELLDAPLREAVRRRLAAWIERHLRERLAPLFALREAPLVGASRGLAFTVGEALGTVPRRSLAALIEGLTPSDRRALSGLGVRLGRWAVFLPAALDAPALRLRGLLWCVAHEKGDLPLPGGEATAPRDQRVPPAYYAACGYHLVGRHVLRVDRLERALQLVHDRARRGGFTLTDDLVSQAGVGEPALVALIEAAGFVRGADGGFVRRPQASAGRGRRRA